MFLRLLWESFVRQRRRKALAGIAILLGTTAVTAMLALATTIGDRIHRELAVYGANIVVYPKADLLDVKVGGVDIKPSNGGVYLHETDLKKLQGIFWANNITAVSPELKLQQNIEVASAGGTSPVPVRGLWFDHSFGTLTTGAAQLHPWWRVSGTWPGQGAEDGVMDAVVGARLAMHLGLHLGSPVHFAGRAETLKVSGILTSGDETEDAVLIPLALAQAMIGNADAVSRVEIGAKTRPEDAFARLDPDKLSPKQHDIWYCRPYANSIAYQIREAIPGSSAEQVRRVEQTEGTLLSRISGLMWLVSGAALLAAGFAVSAAMATAVLERRGEIGLMRSLGASQGAIATLFYTESGLLAIGAGFVGYLLGSGLAFWLGARIFPGDGAAVLFNLVLLPVVLAMALLVAIVGSSSSIWSALRADPSDTLRGTA